jgi:hypothetical protein
MILERLERGCPDVELRPVTVREPLRRFPFLRRDFDCRKLHVPVGHHTPGSDQARWRSCSVAAGPGSSARSQDRELLAGGRRGATRPVRTERAAPHIRTHWIYNEPFPPVSFLENWRYAHGDTPLPFVPLERHAGQAGNQGLELVMRRDAGRTKRKELLQVPQAVSQVLWAGLHLCRQGIPAK